MNNKGQYFTLEQMLLFSIGVMIVAMIYFSLTFVSEKIKDVTKEDQMYEISELLNSEINKVYLSPEEITLTLDIPPKISGKGYKIYIIDDGTDYNLTIELEENKISIPINTEYRVSGAVFSSGGKIKIEKIQNQIFIGRF